VLREKKLEKDYGVQFILKVVSFYFG